MIHIITHETVEMHAHNTVTGDILYSIIHFFTTIKFQWKNLFFFFYCKFPKYVLQYWV